MLRRTILMLTLLLQTTLPDIVVAEQINYQALADKFLKNALQGDPIAQNNLGALYLKGRGIEQNYAQARSWFEKAVESELAGAMFNLGMVYLRGYGVPPNIIKANQLIARGAQTGDRDAQFFIGLHYYRGHGVKKDLASARMWFRRAAEQGVAAAMYNLGIMYLDPDPVIGDEHEALKWLEKAADADYPGADITIAKFNLAKSGDPMRVRLGVQQITALAESNNLNAQIHLGMMYTFGQSVQEDHDEGRFWLERAASQGAHEAQLNLGNIFAEGLGVEKNLPLAFAWYAISADNGDEAAAQNVKLLAEEFDDETRMEAAKQTRILREKFGDNLNTDLE